MSQKLPKAIRPEDFIKLVKALKPNDKIGKTAFLLSYGSGLRISEVVGLKKWKSKCCNVDIIKKRRYLEHNRSVTDYLCMKCENKLELGKTTIRSSEPDDWEIPPLEKKNFQDNKIKIYGKGAKERIVPIPKHWKSYMFDLLPIKRSSRALEKKFNNTCKKVGINLELTYHSLRHGFGTRCIEAKMPLSHVQYLLGHSNLSTTSIYVKANPVDALKSYEEVF